jgi:MATE family multidrug resistance protein
MLAPVVTLIVAAPLNFLLNYLLVWGPEPIRLGFIGAPLATACSMNAMVSRKTCEFRGERRS